MTRKIIPPVTDDRGDETHPAMGMIGASRGQHSPPGAVLYDSDIRHGTTITVSIGTGSRRRDLNRDWLRKEKEFVEVEMSEAQWASFVSSMNTGNGVPCTIRRREDEYLVPGLPPEARLKESIDEVRGAAQEAFGKVREALDAYTEKKTAANLRHLTAMIKNAPANIAFAGDSLTEHAENVVQKARADIEAMVTARAQQLGIDAGDLAQGALDAGDTKEENND